MRARLEQAMDRYGQTAALFPRDGGPARALRAFLQPLLRERQEPPAAVTPLGPVSEQRWLYIGRAAAAIAPGDRVAWDGRRLTVQEVQNVYWQDEVLYQRAILRREKEAAV